MSNIIIPGQNEERMSRITREIQNLQNQQVEIDRRLRILELHGAELDKRYKTWKTQLSNHLHQLEREFVEFAMRRSEGR